MVGKRVGGLGGRLCGGDFAEAGEDIGIDRGGADEIDVPADHFGRPVPPSDFEGGCLIPAGG